MFGRNSDILMFLVGSIGQCVDDSFVVSAPGGPGSPLICGSNSGYHSECYRIHISYKSNF